MIDGANGRGASSQVWQVNKSLTFALSHGAHCSCEAETRASVSNYRTEGVREWTQDSQGTDASLHVRWITHVWTVRIARISTLCKRCVRIAPRASSRKPRPWSKSCLPTWTGCRYERSVHKPTDVPACREHTQGACPKSCASPLR